MLPGPFPPRAASRGTTARSGPGPVSPRFLCARLGPSPAVCRRHRGVYFWSCRPPDIAEAEGEEKEKRYHDYVSTPGRKVVGSVIHCVGGDGLGIMTAMVIARLMGMNFWEEFWFEYLVGFAALQNGRPEEATRQLGDLKASLAQAESQVAEARAARPDPALWRAYGGAVLVDSLGQRVGTILRVDPERKEAEVLLGLGRDIPVLPDPAARETRRVSLDQLVFGQPHGVGTTVVALPSGDSASTGIAAVLAH